jgi:acyl-CoA reductase-like NAD-dependent aldehyde dehydrogenase
MIGAQASQQQLDKILSYIDIGRETHKMALSNYQQTKCLLVSYQAEALGFF